MRDYYQKPRNIFRKTERRRLRIYRGIICLSHIIVPLRITPIPLLRHNNLFIIYRALFVK